MLQTAPVLLVFPPTVGPFAKVDDTPYRFDFSGWGLYMATFVKRLLMCFVAAPFLPTNSTPGSADICQREPSPLLYARSTTNGLFLRLRLQWVQWPFSQYCRHTFCQLSVIEISGLRLAWSPFSSLRVVTCSIKSEEYPMSSAMVREVSIILPGVLQLNLGWRHKLLQLYVSPLEYTLRFSFVIPFYFKLYWRIWRCRSFICNDCTCNESTSYSRRKSPASGCDNMGGCLVWSIQFSPQRFQGKEHWLPILSAPVLVEVDFAVLRSQLSSFVLIFIWISTEATWLRITSIVFCTSCQSDTYRGLCNYWKYWGTDYSNQLVAWAAAYTFPGWATAYNVSTRSATQC